MTDDARIGSNSNGGGVRYTTREMFDKIDHKLDELNEKLDQKADIKKVDEIGARVGSLEKAKEIYDARAAVYTERAKSATDWRRWALPTSLTTVYTVLIILTTTHVI